MDLFSAIFPTTFLSVTALQTGKSRVEFPMESLEFFTDLVLPVALWRRADKLTTFMCRLYMPICVFMYYVCVCMSWPISSIIPTYPWRSKENPRKIPVGVANTQVQESNQGSDDGEEDLFKRKQITGRRYRNKQKIEHPGHSKFVLWTPCDETEACERLRPYQNSKAKLHYRHRHASYQNNKTKLHYRLRRVSYRTTTVCVNVQHDTRNLSHDTPRLLR
jgi:hypothetical protein